jgi:hypothetical protein
MRCLSNGEIQEGGGLLVALFQPQGKGGNPRFAGFSIDFAAWQKNNNEAVISCEEVER